MALIHRKKAGGLTPAIADTTDIDSCDCTVWNTTQPMSCLYKNRKDDKYHFYRSNMRRIWLLVKIRTLKGDKIENGLRI